MKAVEEDKSTTIVLLKENVYGIIDKFKQIKTCLQVKPILEIFLRFYNPFTFISRYDSFDVIDKA